MIFLRLERLQFLNKFSTFFASTVLLLLLNITSVEFKSSIPREDRIVLKAKSTFYFGYFNKGKPDILVEILHFNDSIVLNITWDTFPV